MRRKRIKTIVLILLAVIVVGIAALIIIPSVMRSSRMQTGQEWFDAQQTYLDELSTLADSMDNVFVLYITGSMAKSDFEDYLLLFRDMNQVLTTKYEQDKKEHPVKPNTYTYYQKAGCESVAKIMTDIDAFLTDTQGHTDDTDYLIYSYAAFGDTIAGDLAGYDAAKSLIESEEENN